MRDDMYSIYTHKVNGQQLFLNKKEFFDSFKIDDALAFIEQIEDSFWEANKCRPRGAFYSGLRFCFAELDMMGKFYKGEISTSSTAENTIAFMKKYLEKVNKRYEKLSGLIIDMYRHGLMHTHMTKQVELLNGKILGWELQDNDNSGEHLQIKKVNHGWNLVINVNQLIEDTLKAIDRYKQDLNKSKSLLNKFRRGYFGMAVAFSEPVSRSTSQQRQPTNFVMKQYSLASVNFLKNEM